MGISGIGGGGASQSAAQMSAMREKMVARMQQEMDVDGNGSVSKDEFGQADKRMRADAPNGAPKKAPSADEVFSKADLDGDQSLSTEELTKLADSMKPPAGGPPPGGAPPGGAPGGATAGAEKSASGSGGSESSQSSDPADLDHDGKVSNTERMSYNLKKLTEAWNVTKAAGDES